jgi:hypothetical protein
MLEKCCTIEETMLGEHGVILELAAPDTPQQNGVMER